MITLIKLPNLEPKWHVEREEDLEVANIGHRWLR